MLRFTEWKILRENDEQTFKAAIRANPKDPHVWLVYADWLEERGDQRSQAIKIMIDFLSSPRKFDQPKNFQYIKMVDEMIKSNGWQALVRDLGNISTDFRYASALEVSLEDWAKIKQLINQGNGSRGRPRAVEELLTQISQIMGALGAEAIPGAQYVNRGDTYDTTVLYDIRTGRFRITSWGDWYERNERR